MKLYTNLIWNFHFSSSITTKWQYTWLLYVSVIHNDISIIGSNICCIVEYFKSSQFRLLLLLQLWLKLISLC